VPRFLILANVLPRFPQNPSSKFSFGFLKWLLWFRSWLLTNSVVTIDLEYNCEYNARTISECDIVIVKENRNHSSNVWLFCDEENSAGKLPPYNFFPGILSPEIDL